MRQFQTKLKDDIAAQQIEEARAFKAEKAKSGQRLNEKSFEEFKATAGPRVSIHAAEEGRCRTENLSFSCWLSRRDI